MPHCYVMLGIIKFVDKSVNDYSSHRLDHCDVIALCSRFGVPTGVPHSEVEPRTEFKSFTAAHLGSNTNQHTDWTLGGKCIKSCRSVYAPHLVQSMWLHIFSTEGVTMLTGFSRTRWPRWQFSEGSALRNSRENIVNLWVSCYNGNNDRSAWEQGEWLRQNPRYALVLTASFALLPWVLDEQQPRSLVIITSFDKLGQYGIGIVLLIS